MELDKYKKIYVSDIMQIPFNVDLKKKCKERGIEMVVMMDTPRLTKSERNAVLDEVRRKVKEVKDSVGKKYRKEIEDAMELLQKVGA